MVSAYVSEYVSQDSWLQATDTNSDWFKQKSTSQKGYQEAEMGQSGTRGNQAREPGVRIPLPWFQTHCFSLYIQRHHPHMSQTVGSHIHTSSAALGTWSCVNCPQGKWALRAPELSVPRAPNSKIRMDPLTCRDQALAAKDARKVSFCISKSLEGRKSSKHRWRGVGRI